MNCQQQIQKQQNLKSTTMIAHFCASNKPNERNNPNLRYSILETEIHAA